MEFSRHETCRTCLSEGELKSIFDKISIECNKLILSEMVTECTSVKILKDDDLPTKICQKCVHQLKRAYAFKKQCQDVDVILRSYEKKQETDNSSNANKIKTETQYNSPKHESESPIISVVKEETDDSPGCPDLRVASEYDENLCLNSKIENEMKYSEKMDNTFDNSPDDYVDVKSEDDVGDVDASGSCSDRNYDSDNDPPYRSSLKNTRLQARRKKQPWERCDKCRETFGTRLDYYKHQISRHGEKQYQCKQCGKCFTRKERLATHLRNHAHAKRSERSLTCHTCGLKFTQQWCLRQHNTIHTGEKPHECSVCKKAFRLRPSLTRHMLVHSDEAPFSCEHCNRPYRTTKSLRIHVKQMHSPSKEEDASDQNRNYSYEEEHGMFICRTCGRGFPSEISVQQHCVHHDKQKKCDKCQETFTKKSELLKHKLLQHGEKYHQCDQCGKCFSNLSRLKKHTVAHSNEKPFTCEICGVKFRYSGNLQRHINLHRGERPHKCHICNKSFTQGPVLANHLKIHLGGTPSKCEQCGKMYNSPASLYSHIHNKHSGRKPKYSASKVKKKPQKKGLSEFLCSECGKKYASKSALEIHSNVHTGLKPHQCITCGKSFSQIAGLRAHSLVHTGEKPFKCEVCGRGFTQRQHLVVHMRTHTGEKPFVCAVCGKSFAVKQNLTTHQTIHTGATPYQCPVCGKGFSCSNNMKKHQRIHLDKTKIYNVPAECVIKNN